MDRRLLAALALGAALLAAPSSRAGQGTDAFGYHWYDINDPAGCPVEPDVFMLANSTGFTSYVAGPFDIGFPFPFYDRIVTQVWFHQAGLICFQAPPAVSEFVNKDIPTSGDGVSAFIAPYWSFLVNGSPPVYWESHPTEGYFKASFNYTRPQSGTQPLQYEVYLYRSGNIRIEYLSPSDGTTMTIGMEGWTENNAQSMKIRYNATQMGGLTYGTPTPFTICIDRPSNLNCASATPLSCGVTTASTSPASIPTNVTQWGCGTGTWAGKEKVFQISVPDLSDLNIAVTGTGTRIMSAYLLDQCSEWQCMAGGSSNFNALTTPPGTYYVAVDAAATRDEGAFNITVNCTPLSDPIACGQTLTDTTVGQPGRLNNYPCLAGDWGGAEQFYSINFVPPGNLNVSLASGTNQGVFILDASQPVSPAACLVGGVGGAVLFSPPAGNYLIAVDGPTGGDGPYTLTLNCQPEISCTPLAGTLQCQQSVNGSTIGLAPRADFYRCVATQFSGPEAVYEFDQTTTQTVSFVLDSANPDLDLILLNSCNEGDCVEVGDDVISKELAPGTYYLVVDGKNGASGDFTLSTICGFGLEPAYLSVSGAEGQCFTEHKQGWLTPELVQADVLFSIDLTGSMGGVRSQLQTNMNQIIDNLQTFVQDVAFGLASYKDYNGTFTSPAPCSYSQGYGGPGDYSYELEQPITTDRTLIQNAVNNMPAAGGGGDLPEAYNALLYNALADPGIQWRPNSRRIIVDFGDEMPHECDVLRCLGDSSLSPRGIDPGPDNTVGTADDLATMPLIQNLAANDVVLLHLTNSGATDTGSSGATYTYTQIWDCWAQMTGGTARQLNTDGTVPDGTDLSELVAELIRAQGSFCRELKLVAEPGYESWVQTATPVYTNVELPASASFDITFCVPTGTPPGPYDFLVRLMCGDQIVTTQQVHVDVTRNCAANVVSTPQDQTMCFGDSAGRTLDASGMTLVNCAGTTMYEWRDDLGNVVGNAPTLNVTPTRTTTYTVNVFCSADAACSTTASATITVEQRPQIGTGSVDDLFDCNLGLMLTWDPTTFASGLGSYNVYRSEISCADAMTRPPINARDLRANSFIDPNTRSGRTYYYVVQAEESQAANACRPPGPNNGGILSPTTLCLGPVTDIDNPGFPALLGWSLRVHHQGQQVTNDWTGARALLPGEHFHVLKGTDPRVLSRVNPEGQLTLTWTETDTTSRLQFFDIRIANSCEEESDDDEPPGWDADPRH